MLQEDPPREPVHLNMSTTSKRSKRSSKGSLGGRKRDSRRNSQRSNFSAADKFASSSNANFVEYVVGGDTLLPKRVRSKKSDMPYSDAGSHRDARMSVDAAEIIQLQKQIGVEPEKEDEPEDED